MLNTHPLVYICREWLTVKLLTSRRTSSVVERKETDKEIKQQECFREETRMPGYTNWQCGGDVASSLMVCSARQLGCTHGLSASESDADFRKLSDALSSHYSIALEGALIFKWCVRADIDHLGFIPPYSPRNRTRLSWVHCTLWKRVWCGWETMVTVRVIATLWAHHTQALVYKYQLL